MYGLWNVCKQAGDYDTSAKNAFWVELSRVDKIYDNLLLKHEKTCGARATPWSILLEPFIRVNFQHLFEYSNRLPVFHEETSNLSLYLANLSKNISCQCHFDFVQIFAEINNSILTGKGQVYQVNGISKNVQNGFPLYTFFSK